MTENTAVLDTTADATATATTPPVRLVRPVSLVRRVAGTPIWERLIAEWKPRLHAAHLTAIEAEADTEAAMGDWAP